MRSARGRPPKLARALLGACAVGLAALALSGCGTTGLSQAGSGDVVTGKELYIERCGSCHVLADAGTRGVIGPNLDDAFRQSRADGLGETTIQTVVRGQIAYPVVNPPTGVPGMPADLVTGEDAHSVAAYVASVAGLPTQGQPPASGGEADDGDDGGEASGGSEPGDVDGAEVFAQAGCGGCHAFEAAGAAGAIGPSLDDARTTADEASQVIKSGRGAMPAFGDQLSNEQIAAVAEYVSQNAGG